MIPNLRSARITSVWESPLWLIFSSLVLFSLIIFAFLSFRSHLFPKNNILSSVRTSLSTTTAHYLPIAIPVLQSRIYTAVPLTKVQSISSSGNFTSSIISYRVEGFTEFALLDIPTTPKPIGGFPVIILDHGYIVPSQYSTVTSYASIANFFANNGYIVLKPDYRGNGNSQGAQDPLQRYNYPVDVMTILASTGNIPDANSSRIYLWGHSMGGEVTLTILEILGKQSSLLKNVKGAVLWAPVTDPAKWFSKNNINKLPEAALTPFPYTRTFAVLGQPAESSPIWQSINPLNFLSTISVPLQLNHGTTDPTVPYSWSVALDNQLKTEGKQIDFISYSGADHNLAPDTTQALQNNLKFFQSHP